MTHKFVLLFASLSGGLAVSLGAFGAHALKDRLTSNGYLATYETAVQYHFIHSLVLLFLGLAIDKYQQPLFTNAAYAMMAGILIFSGSLYVLSLSGIKWLGAITPIGGVGFIVGWVLIFLAALKIG